MHNANVGLDASEQPSKSTCEVKAYYVGYPYWQVMILSNYGGQDE